MQANKYSLVVIARDMKSVPSLGTKYYKHWATVLYQYNNEDPLSFSELTWYDDDTKFIQNSSNIEELRNNRWVVIKRYDDIQWNKQFISIKDEFNRVANNHEQEFKNYDIINENCQKWINGIIKQILPNAELLITLEDTIYSIPAVLFKSLAPKKM